MSDIFTGICCTYCDEEINAPRIQCVECSDVDLCLPCFSCGAEIGKHRSNHSYRLVDHWQRSILEGRGNWTSGEELQLLDAVEMYGFGNWELISKSVGTRSVEEVREEYIYRYLMGNVGIAAWKQYRAQNNLKVVDHSPQAYGPFDPEVLARLPPVDVKQDEADILGYKIHRDDFDRFYGFQDYNIQAEQLVSSLELKYNGETDMEKALKLSILSIYIRRLRERAKRKRIVRDYHLVARFFARRDSFRNKAVTYRQRYFREKMTAFCGFLTCEENNSLIECIEREKELKHRLTELYRYRKLGLRTQLEAFHYEQHTAFKKLKAVRKNKTAPRRTGPCTKYLSFRVDHQIQGGTPGKTVKSKTRRRGKFIHRKYSTGRPNRIRMPRR